MSRSLFAATMILSLAACAANTPATPEPAAAESTPAEAAPPVAAMQCDAAKAQWAVGQAASPDVVVKVVKDSGSSTSRVLAPGQPMTMDYREDRVNIHVDGKNVITEVKCG